MNIIKYILSAHARDRMRERGITVDEVRQVMGKPDMSYPGTKGEMNHIRNVNGRKIRIVCVGEMPRKIITVMVIAPRGDTR